VQDSSAELSTVSLRHFRNIVVKASPKAVPAQKWTSKPLGFAGGCVAFARRSEGSHTERGHEARAARSLSRGGTEEETEGLGSMCVTQERREGGGPSPSLRRTHAAMRRSDQPDSWR
jgi:hypothetical protein